MNDTELDEMLDQWQAPPVPASLRENVRAGFAATLEQKPASRPAHALDHSVATGSAQEPVCRGRSRRRAVATHRHPGAAADAASGEYPLHRGLGIRAVRGRRIPFRGDVPDVVHQPERSRGTGLAVASKSSIWNCARPDSGRDASRLAALDITPDRHVRGVGKDKEVQAAIDRFYHRLCGLDMPVAESLLFSKGGNWWRERMCGRHGGRPRNHPELSNYGRRTPRVGSGQDHALDRLPTWGALRSESRLKLSVPTARFTS